MIRRIQLTEEERASLKLHIERRCPSQPDRVSLAFLIQEITDRLERSGGPTGMVKEDRVLLYHAVEILRTETQLAKARRILRELHPLLGDLKLTDD